MHIPTDLLLYSVRIGLESLSEPEAIFVVFLASDVCEQMPDATEDQVGDTVLSLLHRMGAPDEVLLIGRQTGQAAHRVKHLRDN